eukprot:g33860.t1
MVGNTTKAMGPDDIPAMVLKTYAPELAAPLANPWVPPGPLSSRPHYSLGSNIDRRAEFRSSIHDSSGTEAVSHSLPLSSSMQLAIAVAVLRFKVRFPPSISVPQVPDLILAHYSGQPTLHLLVRVCRSN